MIYLNDQPVNITIFPDKTSQVWKLPENLLNPQNHTIKWVFENEGEFLQIAQLKNLLNVYGGCVSLAMTYLPYGRQDKQISNTSTFALRTFANLLNHLNFYEVICYDPHSNVASEIISHFSVIYPIYEVNKVIETVNADLICYPDKGALSKYVDIYNFPYIYGEKVRDQLTGNITNYQLFGEPFGKNVLIVDDICDGGITFKILAKDLLAKGAKSVVLFVTHGIFSKGIRTLMESGIQRVFTRDGEMSVRHNSIQL